MVGIKRHLHHYQDDIIAKAAFSQSPRLSQSRGQGLWEDVPRVTLRAESGVPGPCYVGWCALPTASSQAGPDMGRTAGVISKTVHFPLHPAHCKYYH